MKLKYLIISIFTLSLLGLITALFVRSQQIQSVSNYQECDNSPGKLIVVVGTRTCITLDGRKFEFKPALVNLPMNVDLTGVPQVPPIFKNKYTFYAYIIYHSPVVFYKQIKETTYQLADHLLGIYYK